ncbi:uncharacterized protein LOC119320217 isoform X6 [Triticum dicoccoides]|uniref:uncharacterized protein LOC119320217 isoform X6 n=1 Tax=Triticum dicoccoides TaxID=85692 RepID=UPI00188FB1FC|nr:uncharacterized protein LOC119320217 isoform X6 [Triticum dicoccoides]
MVLAGQRCVRGMRAFPRGGCRREASLRHCHYSVSFSSSVSSRSKVMLSSSHGAVPSWTDGSDDEYRVTRCCSSFFFSPRDCFHRPGWTTIMLESAEQAAAPTLATTGWGRSALCSEVAQVDVRSKAATAAPGADNRTKGEADELEKIKYSTYTVLLTWSILQTSPCQESVWQVIRSASTSHT